jgi:hypothetical protein
MKKLFTILAIVIVSTFSFTACMEENIFPEELNGGGSPGGSADEDEICVQMGTCPPNKKN